jgi:hypothetical protein
MSASHPCRQGCGVAVACKLQSLASASGRQGRKVLTRNDYTVLFFAKLLALSTNVVVTALVCPMRIDPDFAGVRQRRQDVINILLAAILLWTMILSAFAILS